MRDRRSRAARNSGILLLFIALLFLVISGDAPPPRASLVTVTGQLRYIEKVYGRFGLSAMRFGLEGDSRNFQYYSKEGCLDLVEQSLERAASSEVQILINAHESHTPWFDDRSFHTVYELKLDGQTIRTYEEVLSAWRNNNAVGPWVGYPAALAGTIFLLMHFWKRRMKK